jgi:putative addiction module killer protein
VLARPRNVEVYETTFHKLPFEDWMRGLKDMQGSAAIDARIGLLRRGSLGKEHRAIGDGLIELKVKSGPG